MCGIQNTDRMSFLSHLRHIAFGDSMPSTLQTLLYTDRRQKTFAFVFYCSFHFLFGNNKTNPINFEEQSIGWNGMFIFYRPILGIRISIYREQKSMTKRWAIDMTSTRQRHSLTNTKLKGTDKYKEQKKNKIKE